MKHIKKFNEDYNSEVSPEGDNTIKLMNYFTIPGSNYQYLCDTIKSLDYCHIVISGADRRIPTDKYQIDSHKAADELLKYLDSKNIPYETLNVNTFGIRVPKKYFDFGV